MFKESFKKSQANLSNLQIRISKNNLTMSAQGNLDRAFAWWPHWTDLCD